MLVNMSALNRRHKSPSLALTHEIHARLFTVGYEGLQSMEFIQKLHQNKVAVLIDVRRNPISRKKGFSKTALSQRLLVEGIDYFHFPSLGIESELRRSLSGPADYQELFSFYRSNRLPQAVNEVARIQSLLAQFGNAALLCFERDHHFCHRHSLAQFAFDKGIHLSPSIQRCIAGCLTLR